MSEIVGKNMTEYLKCVCELETSVYKQTAVRKQAKSDLKMPVIKKERVVKPKKVIVQQPKEKKFFSSKGADTFIVFVGVFFMSLLLCLVCGPYMGWGVTLGVTGVVSIPAICVLPVPLSDYLAHKKSYPQQLAEYEKKTKKINDKYEKDMQIYDEKEKSATKEYKSAKLKAQKVYEIATAEVEKLDKPLEETQALLAKLYDEDIIFPKYRNMIAMCSIYEYFASGRCTELTGPTGAYNLYESELRQNLIINQLEQVNANLEQVRKNQYILYQGISETNETLKDVSADISSILSMTSSIAVSSKITAFCAEVCAKNEIVQTSVAVWN